MKKNYSTISFKIFLMMISIAGTFSTSVSAAGIGAGVYAFPAAGQTDKQQQKDKFFCHDWAAQEVGFDPTRIPPPQAVYNGYSSPSSSSGGLMDFGEGEAGEGGVVRDGARGAATGALLGAIAGDAGKGAAFGAIGGALFGGMKRSNRHAEEQRWREEQAYQRQQQQQAINANYNQRVSNYRRAYTVCITSKDYEVK
jgi:outer membrane protein with glycine zipper